MSTYLLIYSNPVEGREDECNEWYDNIHLKEVAQVPGIASAQRFELDKAQMFDTAQPYRYLAIYEVEGEVETAIRNLLGAAGTMQMSDSLDIDNAHMAVFTARTPLIR